MDSLELVEAFFLPIFAILMVGMIIVVLRMVKTAKAVKSGDLVELAKLAKLAESAQSSKVTSWFGSTLIGLILFSVGGYFAAQTIHLYVNGIETSGTIKNIYVSYGGKSSKSKLKRYVLVSYVTQTGITKAEIQIKRHKAINVGKEVKVIYLTTFLPRAAIFQPRAAIRGYADVSTILFLPLFFILTGSLFIVLGAKSWGKKKNDAINEESSFSVADKIIITLILGIIITIIGYMNL